MLKTPSSKDHESSAERGADNLTRIARSNIQHGADAAREGIERARTSATATAETERQTVQQSAKGSAELGHTLVDLLGEQARHNMQVATAIGRAVNWAQVAEIQRDFLTESFKRMNHLGESYRGMMQVGMKSMTFPTRR